MRFPQSYPSAHIRIPAPHKPEFSQHPAQGDLTLSPMSAKDSQPALTPARTQRERQTQGIALVVTLLAAMILMVSMLAITSTMVISSQRTTADQDITLQAQYAAEAGLARANFVLAEIQSTMRRLSVPTGQSPNTINGHIRNFCGGGFLTNPPPDADGTLLCDLSNASNNYIVPDIANRYSIFSTYVTMPNPGYATAAAASAYWNNAFIENEAIPYSISTRVGTNGSAETWYTLSYGLKPERAVQRAADTYRLFFKIVDVKSVGEVRSAGRVVASRQLERVTQPNPDVTQTASGEYFIDVFNPSFSRYVQFRDYTTQTAADGGNQLYFGADERFDGPVHTNGRPGFMGSSTTNPLFTDEFTTAATAGTYSGLSTNDHARMFPNVAPRFNAGDVDIQENVFSQLRASMGGDENNYQNAVTNRELRETWGVGKTSERDLPMPDGVYFSKGNSNNQVNTANDWVAHPNKASGIYVKGNLDTLRFSKTDNTATGRQIIEITQAGVTTRFEQQIDGRWTVKVGSNQPRTLNGSFNGMIYVDGNIASLGGDTGTNSDIAANSQMTLASTGNIIVKNDITYTDDPTATGKENAKNVLGIFTNGAKCTAAGAIASCGSIELDGTVNKDLTVHATMMASRDGQGFGTLNCGGSSCPNKGTVVDGSVSRQVRINVLGGVIESQSQTVSSGSNGYRRAYRYDRRFRSGFSPPFFPKRANWTAQLEPFVTQQQLWQTVKSR